MIKVSIIIPAYNVENEIARCLESCINQTYTNIEIIVVNDGSTDSTGEIIDAIKVSDERVIHFLKENQGLPFARKSGIDIAKGEYFFHLDGDDYLPEDAIFSLVSKTSRNEYDLVIGNYYQKLVDSDQIKLVKNNLLCGADADAIASAMILGMISWSLCFKLIKKDFYSSINIIVPNISIGEDGIGMLQLLSSQPKVFFTNKYVYYYINRQNSMVQQSNINVFKNRLESYLYIREIIIKSFLLSKYTLFMYDIKFHANNFDNIELIIHTDDKLLVLRDRNHSLFYRIQLSFLLFLKKISPVLFNIAIIRIPLAFMYLQSCVFKPKMNKR